MRVLADQHTERTSATMATQEQEQYGPRIYSDFFYMSEGGVSTPMLALKFGRSGRMAATALEQKGLTVRSEVLCRLHSANWSSNVHQQE